MENSLSNRKQRVIINEILISERTFGGSDVPQGSVLKQLLFITYIYNVDASLLAKLFKFAENIKLVNDITELDIQEFQNDIDKIAQWSIFHSTLTKKSERRV